MLQTYSSMNGRIVAILICVFFGSAAYCEPKSHLSPASERGAEPVIACPNSVKELSIRFEKMTGIGSPWKSIPAESLRFGVTVGAGDERNWFTIGYPQSELLKSHLKFERCEGTERTYRILDPRGELLRDAKLEGPGVKKVELNLFMPKDWISWLKLSNMNLVDQTKLPAAFMDLDSLQNLPDGFDKKLFSSPDYLPVAMSHELFHLYQMKRFEAFLLWASDKNPETVKKCQENSDWMKALEAELQDWRTILRSNLNNDELRTILIGILDRRRKADQTESSLQCWKWLNHGECIEGAPTYFSSALAQRAGIKLGGDPLSILEDPVLSAANPQFFDESRGAYYLTGTFLLQAIEKLGGDRPWHEEIESGTTVADVLYKILKPQP